MKKKKKKSSRFAGSFRHSLQLFARHWLSVLKIIIVMGLLFLFGYVVFISPLGITLEKSGDYPSFLSWVLLILFVLYFGALIIFGLGLVAGVVRMIKQGKKPANLIKVWQYGKKRFFLLVSNYISFIFFSLILGSLAAILWLFFASEVSLFYLIGCGIVVGLSLIFSIFSFLQMGGSMAKVPRKTWYLIRYNGWSLWWRAFLAVLFINLLWALPFESLVLEIIVLVIFVMLAVVLLVYFARLVDSAKVPQDKVDKSKARASIFRKGAVIILFVLIVAPFILVVALNSASEDKPLTSTPEDLLTYSEMVPREDNAYYVIYGDFELPDEFDEWQASYGVDPDEEGINLKEYRDLVSGEGEWDQAKVDSLLEQGSGYLEKFDQALARGRFQYPSYNNFDINAPTIPLSIIREIGRYQRLRVADLRQSGNYQRALEESFRLLDFASMFYDRDTYSVIEYLVGSVVGEGMALPAIDRLIDTNRLTNHQLEVINSKLAEQSIHEQGFVNAIKGEYYHASLDAILELAEGLGDKVEMNYYLNKRNFQQFMIKQARLKLAVLRENDWKKLQDLKKQESNSRLSPKLIFNKNALLEIVKNRGFVTVFGQFMSDKLDYDFELAAFEAKVAIEQYRRVYGAVPEGWQEVVDAGYLDSKPVDPYDNQQLKYNKESGKIYSVGENMKDEGGEGDDLSLEI